MTSRFSIHRDQIVYIFTLLRSFWLRWKISRRSWARHSERLLKNTKCCLWRIACHMTRDGSWPHALTSTENCLKLAPSALTYPTGEHLKMFSSFLGCPKPTLSCAHGMCLYQTELGGKRALRDDSAFINCGIGASVSCRWPRCLGASWLAGLAG